MPLAARGYLPQKGLSRFEISTQHFCDSKVHFRMLFQHCDKRSIRNQRNLTLLQSGHINFRQYSAHDRTQTANFPLASYGQRDGGAVSWYRDFDRTFADHDQMLRTNSLSYEPGARRNRHLRLALPQLLKDLCRECLVEFF